MLNIKSKYIQDENSKWLTIDDPELAAEGTHIKEEYFKNDMNSSDNSPVKIDSDDDYYKDH